MKTLPLEAFFAFVAETSFNPYLRVDVNLAFHDESNYSTEMVAIFDRGCRTCCNVSTAAGPKSVSALQMLAIVTGTLQRIANDGSLILVGFRQHQ